jgi:glutamate-1-semialdehyde 2,1-aminomutase
MNHKNSETLFERAKKVAPGGVHSPVRGFRSVGGAPVFVERADGAEIFDVDGNSYIDFCQSWGPLLFGHKDPEIEEAVLGALKRGWSYGTAEPYSLEFGELLTSRIPGLESVRFVSSGTEAVMSVLRLARAATGRNKILKFDGCYHGHVDALLVRAGSGLADMASPDSAGISAQTAADTLVCPLDDEAAFELIMNTHGKEIAAVCIEPLPANNGLLPQRIEFLKRVAEISKEHGSLLVFDEVISGFRVALGGMTEVTGIRPDILCFGKIIGGGFPVGAYGGSQEIMKWIAPSGPVYQAGTLSANPVSMSAGLAMLKKAIHDNPYPQLEAATKAFTQELSHLARDLPFESSMQSEASLFWMVCGKASTAPVRAIGQIPETQKALYSKVFHAFLDEGLYFAPSGYEVGFLSTAHTPAVLDQALERAKRAFKKLK